MPGKENPRRRKGKTTNQQQRVCLVYRKSQNFGLDLESGL